MIPLLLFLLASAAVYVSTVQTAFTILMRLSFRLLAERDSQSDPLDRYLEDPFLLLVPARIVTAAILVAATVLLTIAIGEITPRAIIVVAVGMSGFALGCHHLVPVLIAHRDPERILKVLLPPFTLVTGGLQPLTQALFTLTRRRERAVGGLNAHEEAATTDEGGVAGAEPPELDEGAERRLIRSIFDFGDTLAREVMTPRPDIVAISADATLEELRALFREQEYSRIPVYKKNLDDIVGIAFVKDLVKLSGARDGERRISSLMRPPYFVPDTKRVAELLKEFQLRQVQSAIVVDEYGGTAGLATLEDLLEEIVGEIRDEHDVEVDPVVEEGDGSFVFDGMVNVDEVAERLGVRIERQGFETVGGYLLSHVGRVPTVGESFVVDDLWVEVLEAERRRVTKVRIRSSQTVPERPGH